MGPLPADLAKIGPWPMANWQTAYDVLGSRRDWPELAKTIMDLHLEPSYAAGIIEHIIDNDPAARQILDALSGTLYGRYVALDFSVRILGHDVLDSIRGRIATPSMLRDTLIAVLLTVLFVAACGWLFDAITGW